MKPCAPSVLVHVQTLKDVLIRHCIDMAATGRLTTVSRVLIATLQAHGYLSDEIIALELFGMHGLWITRDYAHLCSDLEVYEVNTVYARYARKFLPNAVIINADSIHALLTRHLRKKEYNFIISDNPVRGVFGGRYCEHFDLFPEVGDYIRSGVLLLNFIYDTQKATLSPEQCQRREQFYGAVNPQILDAVLSYEKQLHRGIKDYVFLPRDDGNSFLALILETARNSEELVGRR